MAFLTGVTGNVVLRWEHPENKLSRNLIIIGVDARLRTVHPTNGELKPDFVASVKSPR